MAESSNTPKRPARGLRGDIQRAREGTAASAEELREFVHQLRGRSPQEMLGVVAASDLVRATILATVIMVVFIAAFTVGPYVWNKSKGPQTAPTAAPATPAKPAPTTVAGPGAPAPGGSALPPGPALGPAGSTPVDPLSALKVNETKTADPKKNPLENTNDDLLKDIGK